MDNGAQIEHPKEEGPTARATMASEHSAEEPVTPKRSFKGPETWGPAHHHAIQNQESVAKVDDFDLFM